MFDWVRVRALPCLGCLLTVTVLLEGEPSAQSEVPSTLDQVFIKGISLNLLGSTLFSTPASRPVPAAGKHPRQHDAAATMLHRWDGSGQT